MPATRPVIRATFRAKHLYAQHERSSQLKGTAGSRGVWDQSCYDN